MLRELLNALENLTFSWQLSTQTSSHNFTLSPDPTAHFILESKQMIPCPSSHTFFKSHHHLNECIKILDSYRFLHEPYLETRISFHKPFSRDPSLHFHLPSKALLKECSCLMPNPPSTLGLHILSYLIKAIFLPSASQPHKNLC